MKIKPGPRPSRAQHSDEYTAYMASPVWRATRAAALERADHRCQICGAEHGLEVHHRTYLHLGAEPWGDLETLCDLCHRAADRRRQGAGKLR
jgi:5-methylcytosine-specific restriction endonuclease McrA